MNFRVNVEQLYNSFHLPRSTNYFLNKYEHVNPAGGKKKKNTTNSGPYITVSVKCQAKVV